MPSPSAPAKPPVELPPTRPVPAPQRPPASSRPSDTRASTAPLIQIEGLTRSVQEGEQTRIILHELTVSFARGEFVVIVGKSGSGKSTLLNLLGGIDLPTSGKIQINGLNLTERSEQERTLFRRKHIGFIFQFFNLVPTLTVLENLLLPLELLGKVGKAEEARARALLDAVGLADRGRTWPDRLSGGEQQRVAVARALVHDPLLVLADEPTGNLDADTGQQVLDLLDRLTRQLGKNLLMVTHSQEVVGLADRVFQMREGRLLARPDLGQLPTAGSSSDIPASAERLVPGEKRS